MLFFAAALGLIQVSCKKRRDDSEQPVAVNHAFERKAENPEGGASGNSFVERWENEKNFRARCEMIRAEADASDGGNVADCISRLIKEGVLSNADAYVVARYYYTKEVLPMKERWEIFDVLDGRSRIDLVRNLFSASLKSADGVEEALNYFEKLPPGEMTRDVAGILGNAVFDQFGFERFLQWCKGLDADEMMKSIDSVGMHNANVAPESLILLSGLADVSWRRDLLLGKAAERYVSEGRIQDGLQSGLENGCVSGMFWRKILAKIKIEDGEEIYEKLSSAGNRTASSVAAGEMAGRFARDVDVARAEEFAERLPPGDRECAYSGIAQEMLGGDMSMDEILNYGRGIGDPESKKTFLQTVASERAGLRNLEEYRRILELSGDEKWVDWIMNGLERTSKRTGLSR
jgi:hypothetical protein